MKGSERVSFFDGMVVWLLPLALTIVFLWPVMLLLAALQLTLHNPLDSGQIVTFLLLISCGAIWLVQKATGEWEKAWKISGGFSVLSFFCCAVLEMGFKVPIVSGVLKSLFG